MTDTEAVAPTMTPFRPDPDATCPTCDWRPSTPTPGGPVHIGVVLTDVVHYAGRCMKELLAMAAAEGARL